MTPVDMGDTHRVEDNAFFRHARDCAGCKHGGWRSCEGFAALVRDFERHERAKAVA